MNKFFDGQYGKLPAVEQQAEKDKLEKAIQAVHPLLLLQRGICLSRQYHFKFFKGCLLQISIGPFLNNLSQMELLFLTYKSKNKQLLGQVNHILRERFITSSSNGGEESFLIIYNIRQYHNINLHFRTQMKNMLICSITKDSRKGIFVMSIYGPSFYTSSTKISKFFYQ